MLKKLLFTFFVFSYVWGTHYDFIAIGSSPFTIMEAVYQSRLGYTVLLVEKDDRLGGAWRTIDVLGFEDIDMGCHWINDKSKTMEFLKNELGCSMKPFFHSMISPGRKVLESFYFLEGSKSFIRVLSELLHNSTVEYLLQRTVKKIIYKSGNQNVEVTVDDKEISAGHIILTNHTQADIHIDNKKLSAENIRKYNHYYLLVKGDPCPKFGYLSGSKQWSRAMNLSHFIDQAYPHNQLIAVQVKKETVDTEKILEVMKKEGLLSPVAEIVLFEKLQYIQSRNSYIKNLPSSKFTVLKSGILVQMDKYVDRWKQVF